MRNVSKRALLGAALALGLGAQAFAQDGTTVPDGPGPNLVLQIGGSETGKLVIDLLPDVAPEHVERLIETLLNNPPPKRTERLY